MVWLIWFGLSGGWFSWRLKVIYVLYCFVCFVLVWFGWFYLFGAFLFGLLICFGGFWKCFMFCLVLCLFGVFSFDLV